jgi:ribosomal-protein-alanine N-acetyltransferase
MTLETENLKLLPCDTEILRAAIEGNEILAKKINVSILEDWSEFGIGVFQYSLDKIIENNDEIGWWTYFPIHKKDNKLIGSGGYKGKPTPEGTVELGYEIAPNYRNQGLATEMTKALIENALKDKRVKNIIAHTLGHENPSTTVLQKCGFVKVNELIDPDEGLVWKWELKMQ